MGWSRRYFVTSFIEISALVQAKKIFKGFLPDDVRHGHHVGHVTQIPGINFCSPYPRRLHINFALIGQTVLDRKLFEMVDVRTDRRTDGPTDGRRTFGIL